MLAGWHLGPVDVKSPVYLCTALFWIYITGTAGLLRLTGVIVALMRVYAPIALLLLTAVALWLLPSLVSYRLEDAVVDRGMNDPFQIGGEGMIRHCR